MTDVERYWEAIRAKWPQPTKPWHELHPMHQQMIMQSINQLLGVLHECNQTQA
jgi:hypothetical protein